MDELRAVEEIALTFDRLEQHAVMHLPRLDALGIAREEPELTVRRGHRLRRERVRRDRADDPRGVLERTDQGLQVIAQDRERELATRVVFSSRLLSRLVIVAEDGGGDVAAHRLGELDPEPRGDALPRWGRTWSVVDPPAAIVRDEARVALG